MGFWNFLGAGIFGFLNEIGTALTATTVTRRMMGVYGMLAIGLATFCLRSATCAATRPHRP